MKHDYNTNIKAVPPYTLPTLPRKEWVTFIQADRINHIDALRYNYMYGVTIFEIMKEVPDSLMTPKSDGTPARYRPGHRMDSGVKRSSSERERAWENAFSQPTQHLGVVPQLMSYCGVAPICSLEAGGPGKDHTFAPAGLIILSRGDQYLDVSASPPRLRHDYAASTT